MQVRPEISAGVAREQALTVATMAIVTAIGDDVDDGNGDRR